MACQAMDVQINYHFNLDVHGQAGTEPTNGYLTQEGHENLLTSPSTLNWRPCMQQ